jgi:tape measure domain-containing protein
MANSDKELLIRISADDKNVVGAFRRLKTSVVDLKKDLATATAEVAGLVKEANLGKVQVLDEAQAKAQAAARNLHLARKEIVDLVSAANQGKTRLLDEAQTKADGLKAKMAEARRELEYFRRQADIGGAKGLKAFDADIARTIKRFGQLNAQLVEQQGKITALTSSDAISLTKSTTALTKAKQRADGLRVGLQNAREEVSRINATAATELPQFVGKLERSKNAARLLKTELTQQSEQLEISRRRLAAMGVASVNLNRDLRALASSAKALPAGVGLTPGRPAPGPDAGGRAAVSRPAAAPAVVALPDARPAAQATDAIAKSAERARGGLLGMANEFQLILKYALAYKAINVFTEAIASIPELTDQYANLRGRLALVTAGHEGLGVAMEDVRRIALATGADVNATGSLYQRLMTNSRQLGLSQQQVARVTDTVNKSYLISGASAQEAAGSVRQFQQALASGVLRGEEFNSVMENAPRLQQALADALGVTTGEMRDMAKAGKLSSDVVVKALLEMGDQIDAEAARMPLTMGRALQNLSTKFEYFLGNLDQTLHVSEGVTASIGFLADHIDDLARVVITLAAGGFGLMIAKLGLMTAARIREIAALRASIIAENELAASRARANLALGLGTAGLAASTTAMAGATGAALGLGRVVAFMGGPLGIVAALLTAGAALWATWGVKAEEAGKKGETAAERLKKAAEAQKTAAPSPADDLDTERRRIADLRAQQAGLGLNTNAQGFAVLPKNATAEDTKRLTDWYKLQGQIVTATRELDRLEREFASKGIKASTQSFIEEGQTQADALQAKMREIRDRFEAEKGKLNIADPNYQASLKALERSLKEQLRAATGAKTPVQDATEAIKDQVTAYESLEKAAREAWHESLKSEKEYRDEARKLRARAAAEAVDTSTPAGQASANFDLTVERMKLDRLVSTPGTSYEDIKAQAEAVRDLTRAVLDGAKAKDVLKETDLAQARGAEQAAAQTKASQQGIKDQWDAAAQTVKDLKGALESLAQGTPINLQGDQAKAVLAEVMAGLDALKDKTITVNVVPLGPNGELLQNLSGQAAVPGRAEGGPISGPGGPTEDRILARLSDGEHVLTAAEVRAAGGHAAVYRLRAAMLSGLLPRFAAGGPVLSSVAAGATRPEFPHLGQIDFGLDGARYPVFAGPDTAEDLRRAARKVGRRI